MTKCVVENNVGNWDQRKEVENHEKRDEVCEECCDADGQISKHSLSISYQELHKDVPYHPFYLRYIFKGLLSPSKKPK